MKRPLLLGFTFCMLLGLVLPPVLTATARAAATSAPAAEVTEPAITKIRGRVVTVQVPAGFERVTLQTLVPPRRGRVYVRRKAVAPEWKTVAIQQADGAAATLTFRLAKLTPRRNLRVIGNRTDTLPGSLFTGITDFLGDAPAEISGSTEGAAGGMLKTGAGDLLLSNSATLSANGVGGAAAVRSVVEADIWKVNGDRLYFFNERRGLQVFDIANPDDPALLGTLQMPASGEDMYLLDDAHVVLLKKAQSYWWWNDWSWGGSPGISIGVIGSPVFTRAITLDGGAGISGGVINANVSATSSAGLAGGTLSIGTGAAADVTSNLVLAADSTTLAASRFIWNPQQQASQKREIVVADVSGGKPVTLGRVEFEGNVRESRLVGKVLYLATEGPNPLVAGASVHAPWGVTLTSFDLHDPARPVRRASIFLGGYANAVSATDRFFFVAKTGGDSTGRHAIDIIDISDPNGAMAQRGQVLVDGYVADKFKLNLAGDTLTVVSAVNRAVTGAELVAWRATRPWANWTPSTPATNVATFSLIDPAAPQPLDSIDLARGETVRATRFDRNVAYVVTFQQIDPLWIIDLRNPASLKTLGHVEAPGFSTYIEPLGDRLATIGYVNWKPAVSLFDVSDPAAPRLLTQEVLGGNEWITSEATSNEKAFGVFPDQNLILLPLSQWRADGKGGGVQLFDLLEDRLVKRGVVRHDFDPRRTALKGSRIVAISPTNLVTINAANRDRPEITSDVQISWPVNRVFLARDYLVQLGSEWSGGANTTTLTVSPAARPDESLATLELASTLPVIGAIMREGVLYVLQHQAYTSDLSWDAATQRWIVPPAEKRPANLALAAVDLSRLPAVSLLGQTSVRSELAEDAWLSEGEVLAIAPGALAWSFSHTGNNWFRPYWYDAPPYTLHVANAAGSESMPQIVDHPGRWYPGWVYNYTQRVFTFDVTKPDAPKLASALEIGRDKPWNVGVPVAGEGALYCSFQYLGETFAQNQWNEAKRSDPDAYKPTDARLVNRHFLQVADYSDPTAPKLEAQRPNLPGRLVGVARDGALLLTIGQRYAPADGAPKPAEKALHASALDGAVAHLVDQLPLTSEWQPFALRGDTVFLFDAQAAQIWKPLPRPSTPTQPAELTRIALPPIYVGGSGTWEDNPKLSTLTTWQLGSDGKFTKLDEAALGHETQFALAGDLAVAWVQTNSLRFLDATDAAALLDLGAHAREGSPWVNVSSGVGDPKRGLWIPADSYGVDAVLIGE